jgi:RNA recognition motif-containing protein
MAWVTYASASAAANAVKLNGVDFNGRAVRAELATPKEPRESARGALPEKEGEPAARGKPPLLPSPEPKAAEGAEPRSVATYKDRVMVRGLPREVTEDVVRSIFASVGGIKKIRISRVGTTVNFETEEAATAATGLSGTSVEGSDRPLKVNLATKKGRGGGGGGSGRSPRAEAASPAEGGARRGRKVEVTGAPADVSEDSIKTFFASAGGVERVLVRTGGSVIVTFATADGADAAIAKSGSSMSGSAITVVPAASRRRGPRAEGEAPAVVAEPGAGRRRTAEREPIDPAALVNLIWVSGLTETDTEASIRSAFAGFGAIAEFSYRITKPNRAYAYVKYETAAAVEKAINATHKAGLKVEKAVKAPRKD